MKEAKSQEQAPSTTDETTTTQEAAVVAPVESQPVTQRVLLTITQRTCSP